MKKKYGSRIRLTPKEVDVIQLFREGKVELNEAVRSDNGVKMPKVLVLDIETAPLTAFLWRLRTNYISTAMLEKSNWFMLSWSAKWLFSNEMMNDVLTPKEVLEEDDERIARSVWSLIDDADVVITHNGKNFDHKMLNMRWLINGFPPPSMYKVIDTYQVAKGVFLFPSYRLDYIAKELGFKGKLAHEGQGMWRKCLNGDPEALKNMMLYNDQDVYTLEDVYLLFRPWIKNHPNIGLYMETETPVCSACGSDRLHEDGVYRTSVNTFKAFRCDDCGSPHNRQRTGAVPKEIRKKLLSGVPGT